MISNLGPDEDEWLWIEYLSQDSSTQCGCSIFLFPREREERYSWWRMLLWKWIIYRCKELVSPMTRNARNSFATHLWWCLLCWICRICRSNLKGAFRLETTVHPKPPNAIYYHALIFHCSSPSQIPAIFALTHRETWLAWLAWLAWLTKDKNHISDRN